MVDTTTKETEVKKAKKADKEEVERKCKIEQVLSANIIDLIRAAPHNDTARAVVLARLKQPIPAEHKTFEAIKEWIETTIEFNQPKAPKADSRIEIPINGSDTEHGRARYHVNRAGRGNFHLSLASFLERVAEANDMDELVGFITDEIDNNGWEDYVSLQEGDYNYEDHETDDDEPYTDGEWDYQSGHKRLILDLIRQHAPNLVERFTNE